MKFLLFLEFKKKADLDNNQNVFNIQTLHKVKLT